MRSYMYLVLGALFALATAAPTLKFDSGGKSTSITWDGATLSVPQHCRQQTCTTLTDGQTRVQQQIADINNALAAQANENAAVNGALTALSNENAALRKLISELTTRVTASERAHNADVQALLDAESAYKAADIALANSIDTVTKMSGPKGEKGDVGAPGAVGATGERGAAGRDGEDGAKGARGVAGKDGAVGAPGADGASGAAGATGERGAPGRDGKDGAKGARGETGAAGKDGAAGAPGADGYPGLALVTYRIRQDGNPNGFVRADVSYTTGQGSAYSSENQNARMITEHVKSDRFYNYGGSVSWVAKDMKPSSAVRFWLRGYRSGATNYNDSNGVPKAIVARVGGVADGTPPTGTSAISNIYSTKQSVSIPGGTGKWVVLSNWRIRVNAANNHWAVIGRATCSNCKGGTDTTAKMIGEGIGEATAGFNNIGGQSAFLINKNAGAVTVSTQYKWIHKGNANIQWFNDANGVPKSSAIKCLDDHCAQSHYVSGSRGLSHAWTNIQKVRLPAAGKYLVFANYRIRKDGDDGGFVKMKCKGQTKMLVENVATPSGANFYNYGGVQSFLIDGAANEEVNCDYKIGHGGHFRWWNDANGVPTVIAVKVAGANEMQVPHRTGLSENSGAIVTVTSPNYM